MKRIADLFCGAGGTSTGIRPALIEIGFKSGRLTVISFVRTSPRGKVWLCKCACGNERELESARLNPKRNPSCGCAKMDTIKKASDTRKAKFLPMQREINRKRLDMIKRCTRPSAAGYARYGGRGISVCSEWQENPRSFYDWSISAGYKPGMSLDRIDVNGNYCPENCRYISMLAQMNNRSTNKMLTWNGKTQSVSDWARELKISRGALQHRICRNWDVEKALTTPFK